MPQPYFEMEESRSVTPWVNRLYFESPRASRSLGLRLVKTRPKNLVLLLSGVKPDPMVGSGRYAEPTPVKSPVSSRCSEASPPGLGRHTLAGSLVHWVAQPVEIVLQYGGWGSGADGIPGGTVSICEEWCADK